MDRKDREGAGEMVGAGRICAAGEFGEAAADTITLDQDMRHRRRVAMVSDNGIAFLLDLAEARRLRAGEGIVLDDGRIVEVRAKPEPLYAVRGRDGLHLTHLAWHLGNRHLATAIEDGRLLIRRDRIIRDMVEGLGGRVDEVEAPFEPAGGAYGPGERSGGHDPHGHEHHGHGHDSHGHGHGHGDSS